MARLSTQTSKGISLLLGQSIVSGIFRIANIMILARLLLQAEMGQIALLAIIYGFTQFLGALGLNHAAPLIIPEQEKNGHYGRVRGFLTRSLILITISSATLMLLLTMLSPSILSSGLLSDEILKVAIVIIPFSAMEVFLDSFLLAMYRVRKLAFGRIIFDLTRIFATVILVVLGLGVIGVAYGWLAGEVIVVLYFYSVSIRELPNQKSSIDMRPILVFAIPSLLFQTVDVTIQNTDRIILLILTDLESLGVYDVIVGILFIMIFLSLALATTIYPILTRIRFSVTHDEDIKNEIASAVSVLVRYILILLIPISIIVSINSTVVLTSLFGSSYALYPYAVVSFSLLVLSYSIWGLTYALHTVLRTISETKFFVAVGIGVILFEIVGCWYFTSWLGLLGSALIRTMYIILLFLSSWLRLRQKGISWMNSVAPSFFRIILAALSAGVLVLFIAPQNIIDLVVSFTIAGVIYILLLFIFREINELDFRMARAVMPSFMHGIINRIENIYEKSFT
ncbi:MAG: oligosaccharide flippase family protein [Candidatus Thorarchaeota archaeon]|jgi:O-antigen/teichoic acid export membrane protein